MKNLLMTATLAFALGFVGLTGCAMSSEGGNEDGALDTVEQDASCDGANCPKAHVNGPACNPESTVDACIAAKVAINEFIAKPDPCLFVNRAAGHPLVSGVLFGTSQQAGWVLSTARRANYSGPTNVSLATACAVIRGTEAEQTWTPGTPDACNITVDTNGYLGKWVVDGGVGFCTSSHNYGNGG